MEHTTCSTRQSFRPKWDSLFRREWFSSKFRSLDPVTTEALSHQPLISHEKLQEESKKDSQAFQRSLERFIAVLRERKVDTQLGIELKDAKDFTMDYVLELIRKIGERKENGSKTQACKNFVNKYCRKIEDHKGVIEGILGLVPTDIYGSLLSGGFSLILVVSSAHASKSQIPSGLRCRCYWY